MVKVIKTVFLDVDGVLADFDGGADLWYGRDNGPSQQWGYDYQAMFGMSGTQFWEGLTETFWETLPKLPWADELVDALESRFPGRVVFLTSPPLKGGASGKATWLRKNYPKLYNDKRYLIGPGKSFVAQPNALLIDDRNKNCRLFKEAGGKVVLFPQPWNENKWVLNDPSTDRMHYTLFQTDWLDNMGGFV